MSKEHPIVVVTGSSGAGTSTVKRAFEAIFYREEICPCIIEGDSFHKYDRAQMKVKMEEAIAEGRDFSHFGADANEFGMLRDLFKQYGESGTGQKRYYLHSAEEAVEHNQRLGVDKKPGEFTPWEDINRETDLMFYEGLHGLVRDNGIDMCKYVDLKVGVVPIVNLEWIQKIHRDSAERGYTADVIVDTILRRMPDYVQYITPQFSETDINFQRVSTVDTSNPFIARDIPTPDESFVVIRFRDPAKFNIDFPYLLSMLQNSFMSRRNTIVVPGGRMQLAMEIILAPIIHQLVDNRDK